MANIILVYRISYIIFSEENRKSGTRQE